MAEIELAAMCACNPLIRLSRSLSFRLEKHFYHRLLTATGLTNWPSVLEEAATHYDDDWISGQIQSRGYMRSEEPVTRDRVTRSRRINIPQAAQQLAEGEFNRYYIRGLCLRARENGIAALIVYRGKEVRTPRPESQAKIGTRVPVDALLEVLRRNDFVTIEEAFGVPGGPNSGLTCRLPRNGEL